MSTSPRKLCHRHGSVYIETSELDLRRRKCGKGFSYIDITNRIVRDKALKARIKTLAIPPAWTEVRIASNERAHIQAIGRDSEGRLQYRYRPEWEIIRDETKRRRLLSFGNSLSRVRSAVRSALSKPGLGPTKVVAAVVRLMDKALLRPGHEPYARKEGGRGAATLNKDDVTVRGDTILLDFAGKGGKEVKLQVKDALLARALRQLRKVRGR
jgi:DNA topoisomerase-1